MVVVFVASDGGIFTHGLLGLMPGPHPKRGLQKKASKRRPPKDSLDTKLC